MVALLFAKNGKSFASYFIISVHGRSHSLEEGEGGDGKFAGKNFSNDSLVDPRMIRPERGEPSPGFQG